MFLQVGKVHSVIQSCCNQQYLLLVPATLGIWEKSNESLGQVLGMDATGGIAKWWQRAETTWWASMGEWAYTLKLRLDKVEGVIHNDVENTLLNFQSSLWCRIQGLLSPSPPEAGGISHFPPDSLYPDQFQDFLHFLVLGVLTTYDAHSQRLLWEGETHLLWLQKGKSGWATGRDLGKRASRLQMTSKSSAPFYIRGDSDAWGPMFNKPHDILKPWSRPSL
jgi:hypothetical protein